jgi:hypothetical protein
MNVHITSSLRRIVAALLLAGGLGGCAVYGPPYAYDGSYPVYDYPTYIGPPIALDLGFGYYKGPRHGHYRHHHHHGWRGHGGWGHHRGGGGGHHRGWRGWRGGHGRH